MLLNTKKLAFLGLLLAVTVLLVIFSGILEFNTLFLLAGASFCVGIAIRESGLKFGSGFYLGSVFLSLILAPNKLYCITYAAMGLYLVISEYSFEKLANIKWSKNRSRIYWIIKYVTFNVMYIPMLLFLPTMIYQGQISKVLLSVIFLAGQVVLLVYDKAYIYFQIYIWGKVRGKLQL
jgi:hypothetical protein